MSNNKLFSALLQRMPWARIGYAAGVIAVFCGIFFSVFFSYRFFLVMIERVTALGSFGVENGVTFHLDEYRAIAPAFNLVSSEKKVIPPENREKVSVAFQNAQLRSDRVLLLQELLKNDGWKATVIEEDEIQSKQLTIITAKEAYAKDGEAIASLLLKNGFIVSRGTPLSKEEKFDILITVGAY